MIQRLCMVLALVCLGSPALAFSPKRPVSQPIPPPGPTVPHGEQVLRVLSYNIHGIGVLGFPTAHLGKIGRKLAQLRAQGRAPHIVLIQEAFHAATDDLIFAAGYPYFRSGPGPNWPRQGSGLIILSEFPLIEKGQFAFKLENSAGFDWNAEKGVMYVKARLPYMAQPIVLMNTHMQADYNDVFTPHAETLAARRRQHRETRDWFWRVTKPSDPIIFGGDFNTRVGIEDYYDIVANTFLTNASEYCSVDSSCAGNADPWRDLHTSVDHQFFRPSTSQVTLTPIYFEKTFTEKVDGKKLSDHDGLEVHYRVRW